MWELVGGLGCCVWTSVVILRERASAQGVSGEGTWETDFLGTRGVAPWN